MWLAVLHGYDIKKRSIAIDDANLVSRQGDSIHAFDDGNIGAMKATIPHFITLETALLLQPMDIEI